jgi:hypothetical protein
MRLYFNFNNGIEIYTLCCLGLVHEQLFPNILLAQNFRSETLIIRQKKLNFFAQLYFILKSHGLT